MNIKKTLLNISIILAVIIGVIYFLFSIPRSASRILRKDNVAFVDKSPQDYSRLFSSSKIVLEGSFLSNKRNPVSEFSYLDRYNIWIYKFPDHYRNSIKNVIKENYLSTELSTFIPYVNVINDSLNINKEPINILFISGQLDKQSDIYVNLSGKNCHIIKKNDSIAYYSLRLNNFSISNGSNGHYEIYVNANSKLRNIVPVELMFLKKSNNIYLFIISVKENEIELDEGLLRRLIF